MDKILEEVKNESYKRVCYKRKEWMLYVSKQADSGNDNKRNNAKNKNYSLFLFGHNYPF